MLQKKGGGKKGQQEWKQEEVDTLFKAMRH